MSQNINLTAAEQEAVTSPAIDPTPSGDAPKKKKPIRFKIGVGLLILYPFLYLIIPIGPFLPIAVGFKVGLIAGVLGAAEGIFVLGVACVGKEAYQAIKKKLGLGKKKRAKEEAARLAAEAEAAPEIQSETDSGAVTDSAEPETVESVSAEQAVIASTSSLERRSGGHDD